MKVLITGATGRIGGAVLQQCLKHPQITSLVALVRRELPNDFISSDNANRQKFEAIVVKDFADWPAETLDHIKDADAMIWAMGTSDGNQDANLNYPMAFHAALLAARTNSSTPSLSRFRYIHLSGAFCVQDQSAELWFLSTPRKVKGLAEAKMLEFAREHADVWQEFVLKPGGIMPEGWYNGVASKVFGQGLVVREADLGTAMAKLAVEGEACQEDEGIILNERIIELGRVVPG